jgi:hypothetical protein
MIATADPPISPRLPRQLLLIGPGSVAEELAPAASQAGFEVHPLDDPYLAMAEVCRRPLVFAAVAVCLSAVYREELQLIRTLRHRLPHVEVLLCHTDGRQAAMAEALRLGATGLLGEEGILRLVEHPDTRASTPAGITAPGQPEMSGQNIPSDTAAPAVGLGAIGGVGANIANPLSAAQPGRDDPAVGPGATSDHGVNDPVLSAEELDALLGDAP